MSSRLRLWLIVVGVVLMPLRLEAFTCYFTLAKDSCWSNYDLTVDVIDLVTSKKVITIEVPKGKPWVREKFSCQPAQQFNYVAHFKPIIWESDAKKTYQARRFWGLPAIINVGDTAWDIKVCYAHDFVSTPLPPEARGNCRCDFTVIPPING